MLTYKVACPGRGHIVGIVILENDRPISIRDDKRFSWLFSDKNFSVDEEERRIATMEPYTNLYSNPIRYEDKVLYVSLYTSNFSVSADGEFNNRLSDLKVKLSGTCNKWNCSKAYDFKSRFDDLDI